MSNAPTYQSIPRQVDPRKLAQQGICLQGKVAFSVLPRFLQAVADDVGEVEVDLAFAVDPQKVCQLTGSLNVQAQVICQRCLEPMTVDLHCELNLAVVRNEEAAKQLPRTLDPWIVEECPCDLYEVLEDELLLALPITAYHSEACVEASLFSCGQLETEAVEEKESKPNPFQVLEQLKRS